MLVRVLGLKEYAQAWSLQRSLVEKRLRGEIPDTLLLLEHPPVYTRGASSKALVPPGLPYPLHAVERGGDLTFHGPGQLVGYPIFHLGELRMRARTFLRSLEAVLIEALTALGVEAEVLRGFTGVWCRGKKIASIGIAVKDQVSYHGFALNVSLELAPFRLIHPCRLEPEQVSSLEALLGRPPEMDEVAREVARAFLAYFQAVSSPASRP